MDYRTQIAAILKEWLEMTHAESQAIHRGDWAALRRTQEAKAALRPPLTRAIEEWRAERPGHASANTFQKEVSQLLALETHNSCLLAARKRRALEKRRLLEQALFNLRRVRSSYAPAPELVLNSYS